MIWNSNDQCTVGFEFMIIPPFLPLYCFTWNSQQIPLCSASLVHLIVEKNGRKMYKEKTQQKRNEGCDDICLWRGMRLYDIPIVTLGFGTGTCFHNLRFWRHCLLLLDAVFFKHVHAYGLGFRYIIIMKEMLSETTDHSLIALNTWE
ncbi:hypothetical protein Peur_000426 [Populus x canadensis]